MSSPVLILRCRRLKAGATRGSGLLIVPFLSSLLANAASCAVWVCNVPTYLLIYVVDAKAVVQTFLMRDIIKSTSLIALRNYAAAY